MKVPTWLKPMLAGIVIGAILLAIVGFNWWGWVTTGTAEEMAEEMSETAVTTLIVSTFTQSCVNQAQQADPALLRELATESSSYSQENMIEDAGWATIPGKESPNSDLAGACLENLEGTLTAIREEA